MTATQSRKKHAEEKPEIYENTNTTGPENNNGEG